MEYDYVIVGAGSAGSVLADRLTASGKHSVLVIEAGPSDRTNPWIHFPAGFFRLLDDARVNWVYYTEPEARTQNRKILYPRGKVLGGSSSINGVMQVRGQRQISTTGPLWAATGGAMRRCCPTSRSPRPICPVIPLIAADMARSSSRITPTTIR